MATASATHRHPTTADCPPSADPSPTEERGGGLYRMSLEQYHAIAEAGILGPEDRLILIDGLLVSKMTKGPQHSSSSNLGRDAIASVLPAGWHVRKEDPISLPEGPSGPSEPEPDLAVVRGSVRDFTSRHPLPADVSLVVEVARSSLRFDREMLARYAWAGIPAVWIINLVSRTVEVYTDPSGPGDDPRYRSAETVGEDGSLRVVLDAREYGPIAVRDLLP